MTDSFRYNIILPKLSIISNLKLLLLFLLYFEYSVADEYHEELFIKPLDGFVYSYFQFSTLLETTLKNDSFDHCYLFPRPMGELIQRHSVQELHITLTKGLWRYDVWGYPVRAAPPGAELWAWFKPNTTDVDTKWKDLTGALSGLLCASLNFIDQQNTVSPRLSLFPEGVDHKESLKDPRNHERLRYSSLPREIVCTENLTPWKKLLPCNSKRGLSTLLYSDHIYNTVYHSLGIHFKPICLDANCQRLGIELVQTVSLVYDLVILSPNDPQWSILRLFGSGLGKACPLAKSAKIYIDLSSNLTGPSFTLKPSNFEIVRSERGGQSVSLAVFDTKEMGISGLYNIEVRYSRSPLFVVNDKVPPIITVNRALTGYGQEFGGIKTRIYNRHRSAVRVVLLEAFPWFISVYLHSLRVTSRGEELKPLRTLFSPGRERERPYLLELVLELPPRSETAVTVQFDYTFLKWQEYPPDAHHGFYAGPASLTVFLPHARNYTSIPWDLSLFSSSFNAVRPYYEIRLTTETLIISLATPDFSMPYNVICLACTVVALAFGPLHNITTKRFVLSEEGERKSLIRSILAFLLCFLPSKLKKKDKEENNLTEESADQTENKKDR